MIYDLPAYNGEKIFLRAATFVRLVFARFLKIPQF